MHYSSFDFSLLYCVEKFDTIYDMEQGEKIIVDIYDFDKTAIPYDSALHYWYWSMLHCPWTLVLLPFQLFWGFLMVTKILPVPKFKKIAFNFVRLVNTEKTVKKYWDKHEKDIYDFFKPENRDPSRKTVLISASPDFLIEEIARRMKIDYCIASPHSKDNGHLLGKVCRKEEKVRRLNEILPNVEVENVFSDSLDHDRHIFALGKHCYLANKGKLTEIDFTKEIAAFDAKKKKKKQ